MVVSRMCGLCQGNCQVKVTLEDGKIVKVEPDKASPDGRLCPRGAIAKEFLYGPDRLKYPLIRDGEKGQGKFRRATWDEAIDYAAELIKKTIEKHGPRSLGSYAGRGVRGMGIQRMLAPSDEDSIMYRLGSPNTFSSNSICWFSAGAMAPVTTIGFDINSMRQDVENSDYIFVWGQNPATGDGPQTNIKRIQAAREQGAKLIVIDPRRSGTGEVADLWVPIIPGTDGALALAMLKIIIDEKKYDEAFVQDFTQGFEEFKTYLNTLSLEQLSKSCGVPVEMIRELTEMFCSSEKATFFSFTGVEYQPSAVQNQRAIYTLWAITGKLDVEGGIYFDTQGLEEYKYKTVDENNKPVGYDEFPFFTKCIGYAQFSRFPKAVLKEDPYPMRGLILVGGSPVITYPGSEEWREAYKKLECLIVLEQYPSEDMRFADVVFPACTGYETYRKKIDENGKLVWVEPIIPPVEECREDCLIIGAIAKKLGCGEGYPETMEEYEKWLYKPSKVQLNFFHSGHDEHNLIYKKYKSGLLRADGKPGFPTPSGKFEICSSALKENGYVPYPEYIDVRTLPEMDCPEFPFTLTTGAKSIFRMSALGTNVPAIAKMEPYPFADISAEDAEMLGISEGDWTKVTTPNGSRKFKAHICGMAKSCIHVPHGGGSDYMPKAWKEGNANELTSLYVNDPISGYVAMKAVPCRIEKCEGIEE